MTALAVCIVCAVSISVNAGVMVVPFKFIELRADYTGFISLLQHFSALQHKPLNALNKTPMVNKKRAPRGRPSKVLYSRINLVGPSAQHTGPAL
jgi:hypothetical protein